VSNAIDKDVVDDKALDEYLSGGSEYSQRYRGIDSDAVPAKLDRLVLTEASASAGNLPSITRKRSRPLGYWMRLSAPVALAASVVLVVSIVIRSGFENQKLDSHVALESVAPSYSPLEKTEESVAQSLEMSEPTEAVADRAEVAKPTAPPAPPPAAAPAAKSARLSNSGSAAPAPAGQTTLERVVVSAPTPTQPSLQDSPVSVDVIASEDVSEQDGAAREQVADSESRRQQEQSAQARELQEIVVTGQVRSSTAPSAAGPRGTVRRTDSGESEFSDVDFAKQQREANPEQWLRYIRGLRTERKNREADREWREFVKAYPTYEVVATDTARPK